MSIINVDQGSMGDVFALRACKSVVILCVVVFCLQAVRQYQVHWWLTHSKITYQIGEPSVTVSETASGSQSKWLRIGIPWSLQPKVFLVESYIRLANGVVFVIATYMLFKLQKRTL